MLFIKKTGYIILIFLLLLGSKAGFGQLKLSLKSDYLPGVKMKKVMVCMDDLTVWALSEDGKAYYKQKNQTDFTLYPETAGFVITEVTGFNFNEMYFLVKPDLIYYFKNGVKQEIKIPTVSTINNIAFMNGKRNPAFNKYYGKRDWIAIATDNGMYPLFRGDIVVSPKYIGDSGFVKEDDWHITNSGFKSVDFQFRYPDVNRCYEHVNHVYLNTLGTATIISILPEAVPFTDKVNCTLFDFPFDGGLDARTHMFNFWGTDDGLYIKRFLTCDLGIKVLPDQVINELEELDMLRGVNSQKFVLAATNEGLFYTPASIANNYDFAKDINLIKFEPLTTVTEKVNGIATELYSKDDLITEETFTLCEKVVWLATENGIRALDVSLDQAYYDTDFLQEILFSKAPDGDDPLHPVFESCKGEMIQVTATNKKDNLVIQWFKDDAELLDLRGKWIIDLKDEGTYYYKIAVSCEQINVRSIPFTIKKAPEPEITFNYPDPIILCEGESVTLSTKAGYVYKWYKDDVEIPGETQPGYKVTATGIYHVSVGDCENIYRSSSKADVKVNVIPLPVITSDKAHYCVGTSANLTIGDQLGADIRISWYFIDELIGPIELTEFENQSTITVGQEGIYGVALENESGCTAKFSLPFDFLTEPLPSAVITKNIDETLCYGKTVILSAPDLNGATYKWNTGETTQTIAAGRSGQYTVEVTSEFGCSNTSNPVEVEFYDPILLDRPKETEICIINREHVILTARPGFVSYTWNGIRGTNTLNVKEPGVYRLEVTDSNGCDASIDYVVVPGCKDVLMPNAFSPNGDGTNDVWRVTGLENDPAASIVIYDRFGSPVFKCRGTNCFWDGKMKGNDVPVGVYYFVVKTMNSKIPFTGSITLIR